MDRRCILGEWIEQVVEVFDEGLQRRDLSLVDSDPGRDPGRDGRPDLVTNEHEPTVSTTVDSPAFINPTLPSQIPYSEFLEFIKITNPDIVKKLP